jgi:hypothetical protein
MLDASPTLGWRVARFRWKIGFALLTVACATGDSSCDASIAAGPSWGGGGGTPYYPPGSFFYFTSGGYAVEVNDTLTISAGDAFGAVWSVSDTTIATIAPVAGISGYATLVGRAPGVVTVTVEAHSRALTRRIAVVPSLCRVADVVATTAVGADETIALDEDDCALAYSNWLSNWPSESVGHPHSALRAEGRRLVLSEHTMLRIDLADDALHPFVILVDSSGWVVRSGFNPWEEVFVAGLLPPGTYTLWSATDQPRATGDLSLRLKEVALCVDADALPLTFGVPVEGRLDGDDCHDVWGAAQERWTVTIPAAGYYRAVITPTQTAKYEPPALFRHENSYVDASIQHWTPGTYVLIASARTDVSYRLLMVACASETSCP